MEFQDYIKPELLVLIPVLYLIGIAVKKSKLNDKFIPLVLGAIGIVLAAVYVIANGELASNSDWMNAVFTAIVQGILVAGASVYTNQIFKQLSQKEATDNDDAE